MSKSPVISEPFSAPDLALNREKSILTWQRLETMRHDQLGIQNYRYSRHFNNVKREKQRNQMYGSASNLSMMKNNKDNQNKPNSKNNSIAPFATVAKPTCGWFFSFQTNNKKSDFGIPPTNLVRWRSFINNAD